MNRVAIGQSMVLRQCRKDPRLPQHDAIAVGRQWCPGYESDARMPIRITPSAPRSALAAAFIA